MTSAVMYLFIYLFIYSFIYYCVTDEGLDKVFLRFLRWNPEEHSTKQTQYKDEVWLYMFFETFCRLTSY